MQIIHFAKEQYEVAKWGERDNKAKKRRRRLLQIERALKRTVMRMRGERIINSRYFTIIIFMGSRFSLPLLLYLHIREFYEKQ